MNQNKIILDLCGGTGAWSKPYAKAGYTVKVIDPVQKTGDVRLLLWDSNIYGILAAPPCTHLAGSGARWWPEKGESALLEALSVVDACLRIIWVCKPRFWALENPVGRLSRYLGKPREYFNPCDYGDPWTKKTCLWGNFVMPEKSPVEPTEGSKIHKMAPSPDRWKQRSITPPGFVKAFFEANQ